MKNSKPNNNYSEDEIDLKELVQNLINSKKIIIIITLVFALLAFTYAAQKDTLYNSNALIEIGSFTSIEGTEVLIETIPELIKNLTIELIYKQQVVDKLTFKSIEDKVLEINYTSPVNNSNFISNTLIYVQNRHSNIMTSLLNPLLAEIKSKKAQIISIENSLANQTESAKLKMVNERKRNISKIPGIDAQIYTLNNKINLLLKSIDREQSTLDSLQNRNAEIPGMQNKIATLENKIKLILISIEKEEQNLASISIGTKAEIALGRTTLNQIIHGYKITILNYRENVQQLEDLMRQITKDSPQVSLNKTTLNQIIHGYKITIFNHRESIEQLTNLKDQIKLEINQLTLNDISDIEKVFNLTQDKNSLELQLRLPESVSYEYEKIFEFNQEISDLEIQIKSMSVNSNNQTKLINDILTSQVPSHSIILTLLGAFCGFIFSVFIVLVRKSFFLNQN
tara:strand:- start:720 stop:2081 length:1362 start_codon:yes stop_codon:yes gene_type:complete